MNHDVIIAGGGPVGAALAHALRDRSVGLLAAARRAPAQLAEKRFDSRVYALSPANVAFLRAIGVWQLLSPARLEAVRAMHIFGDAPGSSIEFDAYRAGVPELAWIVEDAALQDALWQGLDCIAGEPERIEVHDDTVHVSLRDGRELRPRLLIGADGAQSFVRRAAGVTAKERDYGQTAVVANFRCEKPHRGTAYQWFQRGPVLALLPLPGDQVSMVWSLPTQDAARVVGLESAGLCREVEAASHGLLGALEMAAAPRSYPLRRLAAARMVVPRVALAGDAAHVIHPLAGQGLNLGLGDVRELAAVIGGGDGRRDPGDLRLLRRYERRRAEPILAMNIAVEGLFTLFKGESRALANLRNAGLNLADRVPVLKNVLMHQAMS